MKRSNAPIFWALFGAGGMISALLGPMLVLLTGMALPLGWLLPRDAFNYAHMLVFAQHWAGKGFVFIVITLCAWHAAHRIFHSLHDVHVHTGWAARLLCYGSAMLMTVASAVCLVALGW